MHKSTKRRSFRYRQLSRLFELRDNMIHQLGSFVANPMITRCQAKSRCVDVVAPEVALLFLQRWVREEMWISYDLRRRVVEQTGVVDVMVHGDISVVAQFITELNVSVPILPEP